METLLQILGLSVLVNMYTFWFNPFKIQQWKDKQITRFTEWYIDHNMYWLQSIFRLLYCEKCIGFWVGLIYFQNIFYAAITSLLAYSVKYIIFTYEHGTSK